MDTDIRHREEGEKEDEEDGELRDQRSQLFLGNFVVAFSELSEEIVRKLDK